MKFKNPSNGYVEEVSSLVWLWVFLFPGFYFGFKGVWSHFFLGLILALFTYGISIFIYPFFAVSIMQNNYLRRGWIQIY